MYECVWAAGGAGGAVEAAKLCRTEPRGGCAAGSPGATGMWSAVSRAAGSEAPATAAVEGAVPMVAHGAGARTPRVERCAAPSLSSSSAPLLGVLLAGRSSVPCSRGGSVAGAAGRGVGDAGGSSARLVGRTHRGSGACIFGKAPGSLPAVGVAGTASMAAVPTIPGRAMSAGGDTSLPAKTRTY